MTLLLLLLSYDFLTRADAKARFGGGPIGVVGGGTGGGGRGGGGGQVKLQLCHFDFYK